MLARVDGAARGRGRRLLPQVGHLRRAFHRRARVHRPGRRRQAAPLGARAYPPAQRLFHSALPRHERFLSYDRYWSEFKEEPRLPEGEPFYRFGQAPAHLRGRLADLAVRAFNAVGGQGYGRVDIRLDEAADELFVLEVNANCGISGDKETSVGEILLQSEIPATRLVSEIFRDAYDRHRVNGHRRLT